MKNLFNTLFRPVLRKCGVDLVRYKPGSVTLPPDFDIQTAEIFHAVKDFTMTDPERVYALIQAIRYIVANDIPGDFVECGVWRGGSAMAMALALRELGKEERDIYLYDTYAGMSEPSEIDVSCKKEIAREIFLKTRTATNASNWCFASLDEVRENMWRTGYPADKLHLVKGMVEETIPGTMPKQIALLRLDTDFYKSTKHELAHLYPLLSQNGVLIIDDYGYWQGVRQAVDEYIAENKIRILLNRICYSSRIAVKTF